MPTRVKRGWRRARTTVGLALLLFFSGCGVITTFDQGDARWLIDLADIARVLCLIGTGLLICAVARLVWQYRRDLTPWQAARFVGLPFACLAIMRVLLERLHGPITPLLPYFAAFLVFELYGVWGLRQGRDALPSR